MWSKTFVILKVWSKTFVILKVWSKTFVILKVWRDGRRNLDSSSEMIDGLCEALSKLDRSDLVEFVQYGEFIECAVN